MVHSVALAAMAREPGGVLAEVVRLGHIDQNAGRVFPELPARRSPGRALTVRRRFPRHRLFDIVGESNANRFVPTKGPTTCSNRISGTASPRHRADQLECRAQPLQVGPDPVIRQKVAKRHKIPPALAARSEVLATVNGTAHRSTERTSSNRLLDLLGVGGDPVTRQKVAKR